ncbi:MAG: hypothetical protein JWP76_998 [Dactylosporangium sp.]|nr:hypothetical protein [Dactylosporangium sp.]
MTQPSFGIDPQSVINMASDVGWAGRFCQKTDHVMGNARDWPDGEETFGAFGALAAYHEFFQRWKAEVQTTDKAADQLDRGLMKAVENYGHGDGNTVQRFGSR